MSETKTDLILSILKRIDKKLNSSPIEDLVKLLLTRIETLIDAIRGRGLHDINSDILETKEACEFLKLSKRTIQVARDTGELSYLQYGGKILYRKEDLIQFIEKYRVHK